MNRLNFADSLGRVCSCVCKSGGSYACCELVSEFILPAVSLTLAAESSLIGPVPYQHRSFMNFRSLILSLVHETIMLFVVNCSESFAVIRCLVSRERVSLVD